MIGIWILNGYFPEDVLRYLGGRPNIQICGHNDTGKTFCAKALAMIFGLLGTDILMGSVSQAAMYALPIIVCTV